jgi:hypothetical protein
MKRLINYFKGIFLREEKPPVTVMTEYKAFSLIVIMDVKTQQTYFYRSENQYGLEWISDDPSGAQVIFQKTGYGRKRHAICSFRLADYMVKDTEILITSIDEKLLNT